MSERKYLVDLNVLIALVDVDHEHHRLAQRWFEDLGSANWGTCILTETGFVRVMSNPRTGRYRASEATQVLAMLLSHPRHKFWPIIDGWSLLSAPFAKRIFGHQQVTDACLLGLAVRENGMLVTIDKAIAHLAGVEYKKNLFLLDPD